MDNPEKAAVKEGLTTAVIGSVAATLLANPVCWAAVIYGTYRMGKAAYRRAKINAKIKANKALEDTSFWHV
jgi:uncharacterized protein (DUF2062 family)